MPTLKYLTQEEGDQQDVLQPYLVADREEPDHENKALLSYTPRTGAAIDIEARDVTLPRSYTYQLTFSSTIISSTISPPPISYTYQLTFSTPRTSELSASSASSDSEAAAKTQGPALRPAPPAVATSSTAATTALETSKCGFTTETSVGCLLRKA